MESLTEFIHLQVKQGDYKKTEELMQKAGMGAESVSLFLSLDQCNTLLHGCRWFVRRIP